MRILHIGKYYPPARGGMERIVCELAEGAAERGHDVGVIAASHDSRPAHESISGIEVNRLRTWGQVFSQPLIGGLTEAIARFEPDLLHFHLPNPLALVLGSRSAAPRCVTVHALPNGMKGKLDRWLTGRLISESAAVIFSSESLRAKWLQANRDESRGSVIPFGLRHRTLPTHVVKREPRLALFVGRLVSYKGVSTLVQAMTRVDGRVVVVGDGPERKRLEWLARDLGVATKVSFVGAVEDSTLAQWYERCSVYVQPSISESEAFGISMLEAMHFGRPVISTDLNTGVRDVNRHLETGLVVPPADALSLAAAMNTIFHDQALMDQLGRAARMHEAKFDFAKMIDAHLSLYESLVGAESRGRTREGESSPSL